MTLRTPAVLVPLLAAVAALPSAARAQGFGLDWMPTQPEVLLDTAVTTITPTNGVPMQITGGVFVFRSVVIPQGVTVRAVGPNPLIFVVQNDFRVDGSLLLDGADGQRVDTLGSANFPSRGGRPGPAGGAGGLGSPFALGRSPSGEPGHGPFDLLGLGGAPGLLSCVISCRRGSGGGGGSFATAGDLDHLLGAPSWTQVFGDGGFGCRTGTLAGGMPGAVPFVDGQADNDFFGIGVDVSTLRIVRGELPLLMGGQGGGGGGDMSSSCAILDPNFVNDSKGGGGGGAGGALLVASLRRVIVGPTGRISCDGGNGGGGEQAGSNNQGGGGGGGSGGMLALFALGGIELHVKGETYRNGDAEFVLSADGGVGAQGNFAGIPIAGKYPAGLPSYGSLPAGGYGGLGIIQLVAPFGANRDNTNTILDDGITVFRNGAPLTGAQKTRFLGWRGYQNAAGVWVDDSGAPTGFARGEGDMRPAPVLLPIL